MVFYVLQEMQSEKEQAEMTKRQRAAAVIENEPTSIPEGMHVLLTSNDDRIACTLLQVMRLMQVHDFEEDISMKEKWEMVRAKLKI